MTKKSFKSVPYTPNGIGQAGQGGALEAGDGRKGHGINKSLYMTAMNMVRHDCEQCAFIYTPYPCPSEAALGRVGHLPTCAKAMFNHLSKKGGPVYERRK